LQRLGPVVLMYEEFFGLRARPFGITPSVDLFFHSSAHRRTLAYLQGHVLANEPVILLTGSIGAGKTTVLQALLRALPNNFAAATVVSTQLDDVELTRSVLLAFGAQATGGSLDELRAALRSHLEDLCSRGRRGLLVVDEAQNFSAGTLRYLLHLPELGGGVEEASLQAIISGQPGLHSLLLEAAREAADQLPFCRLGSMSTMDTGSYVRHRLRVVGTTGGPTFSEDALDEVHLATGGLPRLVNRLCERVLMSAYLDGSRDIDSMRVARAAAELREELDDSDVPPRSFGDHPPVPADPPTSPPAQPQAMVVGSGVNPDSAPAQASPVWPAPHLEQEDPLPSSREPEPADARSGSRRRRHYWPAATAAGLLAVAVGWLAHDRSGPQNTTRPSTAASAGLVAPAGDAPNPDHRSVVSAPTSESSVSEPYPAGQLPVGVAANTVVPKPMRAPSSPVDAQAALGLTNPAEPTTTPPAVASSCNEATKALGLCP